MEDKRKINVEEGEGRQLECYLCDSRRLQLFLLKPDPLLRCYILSLLCLNCGALSYVDLPSKTIINIGDIIAKPKKK